MTTPATLATRLNSGELRRQVAAYLADNPTTDHTSTAVARHLGRSSGAVGNALKTLRDRGQAAETATSPLRYRATATTKAAAAGAPAPVPAPAPVSAPAAPPRPAALASATPVTGPLARPNGLLYHPRTLSGIPDVTALRKLRESGVAALMYGPPGTGKTSVVEAAFGDVITVQGDGDTTVADLVGEYTQTPDGRFVFVHGPVVRAMREGKVLFVDDATLIPPTVLAVLYPAMDGRRQIIIKANGGEAIDAAEGFYTVAGHNPGVHGAVLSDALASRFAAHIKVTSDYDLAAQMGIDRRAVKIARNLHTRMEEGKVGWAPQLRELIAFAKIAEALGEDAAAGNLISIAPDEDRPVVEAVVREVFGKPVEPLALGGRI
ncbi:AAA family ATPase [Sphaerisporangium aureirubrum]|uniref:AAA family ATPase n=1 Tax=Sphaerisporangium aureirubrum TaxID=1544736 RepID=A0ABW1NC78_9ACTN